MNAKKLFPDFSDASIEYYQRKLFDDKDFCDLFHLDSSIHQRPRKETTYKISDPRGQAITLSYLLPLIKEGKLKVGRDNKKLPDGNYTAEEYTGTAEEIINRIRMEWNSCVEGVINQSSSAYESGILFTLPENSWPVFKELKNK